MSKREIFGIKIFFTGIILFVITLLSEFDVPEVLEVHVVPSVEVRMVPESPTVTKSPFP